MTLHGEKSNKTWKFPVHLSFLLTFTNSMKIIWIKVLKFLSYLMRITSTGIDFSCGWSRPLVIFNFLPEVLSICFSRVSITFFEQSQKKNYGRFSFLAMICSFKVNRFPPKTSSLEIRKDSQRVDLSGHIGWQPL